MGRLGGFGYFADGTPMTPAAASAAAAAMNSGPSQSGSSTVTGIPSSAGGNAIQGKGLAFTYQTAIISSLANGASSSSTIQFDNNSVFVWLRSTITADIAGAAETDSTEVIPLVTLQITDTGSGMSFMNAPIPLDAIAGNGRLPFILTTPQMIQPNASLQFAFSNYSAATTYTNLRFQMLGFRLFNIGNLTT
jgi:hypothetical protein